VNEAEVDRLRRARERVLEQIADACARVGRDPASVTLVAVSKTVDVERLRAAVVAGLTTLAENRVQEGEAKVPLVPGASWHLVGPLQSNKARRAIETFSVIQSVDSTDLARRLDRLAADLRPDAPFPVLLQVNIDDDTAKAGFDAAALARELGEILELPRLDVRGLMTIGRLTERAEDARSTFRGLRELTERLRGGHPRLGAELSMGMSADFDVAVEEGATMVRVGQALFGERPHDHDGHDGGGLEHGDLADARRSRC
jgi:pyridoxal phosphate enzyme (YggS family)